MKALRECCSSVGATCGLQAPLLRELEVTPTELRDPHPLPCYRQVIPTGLRGECLDRSIKASVTQYTSDKQKGGREASLYRIART
jgi:hypothetical protein